ncbi:hypothetical protein [Arachnia propionica]|uniref:hypothetical protein n=1 Tax=Arachnia propionica TaxID=1750 RepID=UPI003C6F503C
MNGGDAQLAVQHGVRTEGRRGAERPDEFGDLHAQPVDLGGAVQRRLVDHAIVPSGVDVVASGA